MVLTERLWRAGTRRPHVLVVPVSGYRPVRWAAERYLLANGWPTASAPAEADVLLLCGPPGPDLAGALDTAWGAMPGPRARADAGTAEDVPGVLEAARARLRDLAAQRDDARSRPAPALGAAGATGMTDEQHEDMQHEDMQHEDMQHEDMQHEDMQHEDMQHEGMQHEDMQHEDMQHEGMQNEGMQHEGMDHGGAHDGHSMDDMGMDLPGGLAMADRADDRDGLKLDVLHLSWGPVLPGWPAGLQLELLLQGDVLQEVDARWLDPSPEPPADHRRVALDQVASVLDAAGWFEGAVRARRLRDGDLEGAPLEGFTRRVTRARLLRWTLRRLPAPEGRDAVGHLSHLLNVAAGRAELPDASTSELENALRGLDMGTAALVVAGFAASARDLVPAHG